MIAIEWTEMAVVQHVQLKMVTHAGVCLLDVKKHQKVVLATSELLVLTWQCLIHLKTQGHLCKDLPQSLSLLVQVNLRIKSH
jgi:hypothetical protein